MRMRQRKLLFVLFMLCFLLAACQDSPKGADPSGEVSEVTTTAPVVEEPEELYFEVNCDCELTDPDGNTLHCGGPNDFYGTIEGTPGRLVGEDIVFFQFSVPYRDSYTFQAKADQIIIDSYGSNSSRLFCSGYQEVVWKESGWTIKGREMNVTLLISDIDSRGDGFLTELTFHTAADTEINLTKKSISVTGLQGEPTVSVFDCTKMVDSATLTIPAQGDTLTLDLSELSNSSFAVIADGESTEMQVTWLESEA